MSMQRTPSLPVTDARARRLRRPAVLLVAVLAAVALLGTSCTRNGAAWESMSRANDERNARGLPDLSLDDTLVAKAQGWADHMAATGTVSHSVLTQGAGGGWRVLGENVGWAYSVAQMNQLFMNSAAHRANILSGRYNRIGTGVAHVNGRYYVVQVFAG